MVVKFFSNKDGGSTKAIDYLLNDREANGTARVLKGNPTFTRNLINSIEYKQKVCVGCLSFEEENIDEGLKFKLMEEFETYLLPSLDNSQYNILWVEHTDKNRLELNFVIPKIELSTQKSLQPYYHLQDLPRIEKWQDLANLNHRFSDPKDPAKQRSLEGASKHVNLQKDYVKLDELLHDLVRSGQIQNRVQLIELLEKNQIVVNRQSKEYISIKLPEGKKARRLKGGIYSEQFTSIGEFERISEETKQRVDEYNQRDTSKELVRLKQELGKYTQRKAKELTAKYEKSSKQENYINDYVDKLDVFNNRNSNYNLLQPHDNSKFKKLASTYKFTVHVSKQAVHKNFDKRLTAQYRQDNNLHKNRRITYDSTRTTVIGRIKREREDKLKAYKEARRTRDAIHRQLETNSRELQAGARKLSEQSNQYYEKFEYFRKLYKNVIVEIIKIKDGVKEKIENLLEKNLNNVMNTTKKPNIHKSNVIVIYALCQFIDLSIFLV